MRHLYLKEMARRYKTSVPPPKTASRGDLDRLVDPDGTVVCERRGLTVMPRRASRNSSF